MSEPIICYCFKCKTKVTMKDPVDGKMKNGAKALVGTCSTCGTRVFKFGGSQRPEPTPPPPAP